MPSTSTWVQQAAAIPVKSGQVCLVTSSSGKRWVVPKGCIEAGMTAGESALAEAWEEAGLTGLLVPEPVGSYVYDKYGSTCLVTVFLMRVTGTAEDWPERALRERRWFSAAEASAQIEDRGLRALVRGALVVAKAKRSP
jgi:8-oxo-dGTP pyrophosphatase MutT (NUDIX family)